VRSRVGLGCKTDRKREQGEAGRQSQGPRAKCGLACRTEAAAHGAPLSEICTSAFCTAIAETPSMPARIAFVAFGSMRGPTATQRTRKPASNRNCSSSSGQSEARPIDSKPPANSLVRPTITMKTGTETMWAVNSPLRTRKPMMSVHPAVTLSTLSSAWTARELSTDGAGARPIGPSASADTVPDHLLRIYDLVEPPLVDFAGLERGLL